MSRAGLVVHVLLFQLGWFGCVWFGGVHGHGTACAAVVAVVVAAQLLALGGDARREVVLWGAVTALGVACDSLLAAGGVLAFRAPPPPAWGWLPLWIVALWALFAGTFAYALAWVGRRPWLATVLGAVGGPSCYAAGQALGAVRLPLSSAVTYAVLALAWAAVMALASWLARRLRATSPTGPGPA